MIADRLIAKFEKAAKRRQPQHVNRISSIGWPCERMLAYSIVRWGDRKLPSPELQAIFNEGNHQERALKQDLLSVGIDIEESQGEVAFPEHRLYGHIDGTYTFRRKTRPVEFKSMSEHVFDKMHTAQDFMTAKFPHHRCYIPQLQMYMHGKGLKSGLLVLKNKTTGWVKELEVKADKALCRSILDKCTRINSAVDAARAILKDTYGIREIADFEQRKDREDYDTIRREACHAVEQVMPDRITETAFCNNCPFSHVCLPDEIREERARLWINDGLAAQLVEREAAKVHRGRYEELDKEVKTVIKESGMDYFLCGDFEVSVSRGKAVRVSIERI